MGLPSREERLEYFQKFFAQEMDCESNAEVDKELASCTEGQNWRNISTLVQMILKAKAEAAESKVVKLTFSAIYFIFFIIYITYIYNLTINYFIIKQKFNFKAEDFLLNSRMKKPEEVHVAHEEATPVLGCDESKLELMQVRNDHHHFLYLMYLSMQDCDTVKQHYRQYFGQSRIWMPSEECVLHRTERSSCTANPVAAKLPSSECWLTSPR